MKLSGLFKSKLMAMLSAALESEVGPMLEFLQKFREQRI